MSDDEAEQSTEDLHRQILTFRDELADQLGMPTRRTVLKSAGLLVTGAGAMAVFNGSAAASHGGTPSGEIGTAAEPALKIHTDVFHFHARDSEPSSPDDGTEVYVP